MSAKEPRRRRRRWRGRWEPRSSTLTQLAAPGAGATYVSLNATDSVSNGSIMFGDTFEVDTCPPMKLPIVSAKIKSILNLGRGFCKSNKSPLPGRNSN